MKDKLSQLWFNIQDKLFPHMEEELGPVSKKLLQVIQILEIIRIEDYVRQTVGQIGRPCSNRCAMARAFVAKAILNIPMTNMLVERLQMDKSLRRICGWDSQGKVPSEATFSRAFSEFSEIGLPAIVHEALIKETQSNRIVGHISRDSTEIEAREKPVPTGKKEKKSKKRGRPKKGESSPVKEPTVLEQQPTMTYQELMGSFKPFCNVGTKRNSKGYKESWTGYKLHLDVIDGDIPISGLLSAASVHDSQLSIPLSVISYQRVTSLYDLADAAYDCPEIRKYSNFLGHIDIIDSNPRRGNKIEFCPAKAVRYRQRSSVERVNGRLKDEFGGRFVRVRGNPKVFTHLMFGLLALTADQLFKLVS